MGPCGHACHSGCLLPWVQSSISATCPLCRGLLFPADNPADAMAAALPEHAPFQIETVPEAAGEILAAAPAEAERAQSGTEAEGDAEVPSNILVAAPAEAEFAQAGAETEVDTEVHAAQSAPSTTSS